MTPTLLVPMSSHATGDQELETYTAIRFKNEPFPEYADGVDRFSEVEPATDPYRGEFVPVFVKQACVPKVLEMPLDDVMSKLLAMESEIARLEAESAELPEDTGPLTYWGHDEMYVQAYRMNEGFLNLKHFATPCKIPVEIADLGRQADVLLNNHHERKFGRFRDELYHRKEPTGRLARSLSLRGTLAACEDRAKTRRISFISIQDMAWRGPQPYRPLTVGLK